MENGEPKLPRIPESGKRLVEAAEEALMRVKEATFIDLAAAAELPVEGPDDPAESVADGDDLLDLSAVPTYSKNVVKPQIAISYQGYFGEGSLRAADEVGQASLARNLATPTPAALELHNDKADAKVVYAIPTNRQDPRYLVLEWIDKSQFRANFAAFLRAKEIVIPRGTRMIIDVAAMEHPKYGSCVKLSWGENCFVAIEPRFTPTIVGKTNP